MHIIYNITCAQNHRVSYKQCVTCAFLHPKSCCLPEFVARAMAPLLPPAHGEIQKSSGPKRNLLKASEMNIQWITSSGSRCFW